ncbi:hypothetical protein [Falsiroseomonas oryziterrae]|uniref:hypothetical protein n=1 Tax=Falsiroseomonas oryziterrae TaxID=2911368 RepID=UPI001F17C732|nr:hypothetical protein [Roseomonas sp. NPKOSM-4]
MQVLVGFAASETKPVSLAAVKGISDRASVEAARRLVGLGAASPPRQDRPGEDEAARRAA